MLKNITYFFDVIQKKSLVKFFDKNMTFENMK